MRLLGDNTGKAPALVPHPFYRDSPSHFLQLGHFFPAFLALYRF